MCSICDQVKPGISTEDKSEILRKIGEKIENCEECVEHFDLIMDILLDTPLEVRDPYIEALWEDTQRNGQED